MSQAEITETNRKRAIIAGAASWIGKAAALCFAREGWDLCLVDRNEPLLMEVLGTLLPGRHLAYAGPTDDQITAVCVRELILSEWGSVSAHVNGAGVFMTEDILASSFHQHPHECCERRQRTGK
jgi:NAD(P)-dependent dehydrogenase (short-subunit alcohol dehydrogenase family)